MKPEREAEIRIATWLGMHPEETPIEKVFDYSASIHPFCRQLAELTYRTVLREIKNR